MTTDDNELLTAIEDGRKQYKLGDQMVDVDNKHVPERFEHRLLPADALYRYEFRCMADGCSYRGPLPKEEWHDAYVSDFVQRHTLQYNRDRAPDITVEWVISASCSVCPNGGDIETVDGESVRCTECNTTWFMDGTGGERDERESEED